MDANVVRQKQKTSREVFCFLPDEDYFFLGAAAAGFTGFERSTISAFAAMAPNFFAVDFAVAIDSYASEAAIGSPFAERTRNRNLPALSA